MIHSHSHLVRHSKNYKRRLRRRTLTTLFEIEISNTMGRFPVALIALLAQLSNAFLQQGSLNWKISAGTLLSSLSDSENSEIQQKGDDDAPIAEAVVKIDDGGSDLTNRFKYKVNALMGVFDPQDGVDDERQEGNILNAMLKFPIRYTFNIVGKTSGDDETREKYLEEVYKVVLRISGDDEMRCQITPRGKNFTKVQCEVEVQSASMINSIYDDLDKLDLTVMRF